MKGPQIKKALSMLALGLNLTVFGANQSCDINVQDGSSDPYWLFEPDDNDRSDRDEDDEDGEDREIADYDLAITGSGEILTLSAGHASFAARINWDTGQYFFAPDPEGVVTGDRIVCTVSIDSGMEMLTGECFRSRHLCDFLYWEEPEASNDGKRIYSVGHNTCLDGGEKIGPFLVPLESPLCGQDPFPACPEEDLFPSGVTEAVSSEDAAGSEETKPAVEEEDDQ